MQNDKSQQDLYDVLKIPKNASNEDIKKSFKKLAMQNHPDKGGNETEFKKINEAYCTLSDPDKRKQYDTYGTIDPQSSNSVDINDILKNMFGDLNGMNGFTKMSQGPGSFSFMFSDMGMGESHSIFGEGSPFEEFNNHRKKRDLDVIEIPIDICDIYYGNNKRVEFDLLEQCEKCNGTGAHDSSQIVNCISCNGQGVINQQIGPFFMQRSTCPSCMGKGNIIKKPCNGCKGEKTIYVKKLFELKIPKGIPNNHEIKMDKKGSFNISTKSNKDILFKFKYNIESPYSIDENFNVYYNIKITIDDLLAGFRKNIKLYKDDVTLVSDRYFNPNKNIVIKDKGVFNIKKQKNSDLIFKFNIEFTDSERLSKHNDVMQKVLKKQNLKNDDAKIIINLTENK